MAFFERRSLIANPRRTNYVVALEFYFAGDYARVFCARCFEVGFNLWLSLDLSWGGTLPFFKLIWKGARKNNQDKLFNPP